jgi:hypothetical protein
MEDAGQKREVVEHGNRGVQGLKIPAYFFIL